MEWLAYGINGEILDRGYRPTNIPQWNQKYKVCFSLSDQAGNRVKDFVVTDSDLSQWIRGKTENISHLSAYWAFLREPIPGKLHW